MEALIGRCHPDGSKQVTSSLLFQRVMYLDQIALDFEKEANS